MAFFCFLRLPPCKNALVDVLREPVHALEAEADATGCGEELDCLENASHLASIDGERGRRRSKKKEGKMYVLDLLFLSRNTLVFPFLCSEPSLVTQHPALTEALAHVVSFWKNEPRREGF